VRCQLCAHHCLVRPGRAGICGVRENREGRLWTVAYGAVAAEALEPIEKKPLYHVLPGTLAYSIATPGCDFHCRFCQNWELAQAPREGLPLPARRTEPEELVARALSMGAASIAYTYTEPTVFLEYALATAALARQAGLRNVFVTNGYETPEAIARMAPLIDAANVDLKGFSDRFYRTVCGARLEPVLAALVEMRRQGIWVEVTTLLTPRQDGEPDELERLAAWLVAELGPETPWHVSRFYPAYRMADRPPTPISEVWRAVEIGHAAGLRFVYPGNVPGLEESDTRCAGCGRLLIRRRGYRVLVRDLEAGTCPACGRDLPGVGLA
jgi:pyruvate formate lyase activating enzyme